MIYKRIRVIEKVSVKIERALKELRAATVELRKLKASIKAPRREAERGYLSQDVRKFRVTCCWWCGDYS